MIFFGVPDAVLFTADVAVAPVDARAVVAAVDRRIVFGVAAADVVLVEEGRWLIVTVDLAAVEIGPAAVAL